MRPLLIEEAFSYTESCQRRRIFSACFLEVLDHIVVSVLGHDSPFPMGPLSLVLRTLFVLRLPFFSPITNRATLVSPRAALARHRHRAARIAALWMALFDC